MLKTGVKRDPLSSGASSGSGSLVPVPNDQMFALGM